MKKIHFKLTSSSNKTVPLLRDFSFLRNMTLPYFFAEDLSGKTIQLDEDNSRHIVHVLRMKIEDPLLLTDGKGNKAEAKIIDDHRKHCTVEILSLDHTPPAARKKSIGISLIKNASRFEWFLEKATEIGATEIIPLLCKRTIREKFRHDRMRNILISAMLQSQQSHLPILHEPTDFSGILNASYTHKYIAWCETETGLLSQKEKDPDTLILIGPEGDFTPEEVQKAQRYGFQPVSLGATRLRTETAGMVSITLLNF